jgi:hypothetical protein
MQHRHVHQRRFELAFHLIKRPIARVHKTGDAACGHLLIEMDVSWGMAGKTSWNSHLEPQNLRNLLLTKKRFLLKELKAWQQWWPSSRQKERAQREDSHILELAEINLTARTHGHSSPWLPHIAGDQCQALLHRERLGTGLLGSCFSGDVFALVRGRDQDNRKMAGPFLAFELAANHFPIGTRQSDIEQQQKLSFSQAEGCRFVV